MRSSSRSSRRNDRDDPYAEDFSSEEEDSDLPPPRRRNSLARSASGRSRRGSISAGMNDMSLGRSSSRASRSRRNSYHDY
jgi:hypothetical protein